MTADATAYTALDIASALGQPPPTEEQQAVIEAPLEPTLVVAGAGSGKTETMASRVLWLIANRHVRPDEVLGLTFTRKAAMELGARVSAKLAQLREAGVWGAEEETDGFDLPTVSTYHAYAGRLVAEHGLRLGIEPDARLLSEAAAWQLAHEVVSRYPGDLEHLTKAESTVVQAVLRLSGELAEHLRDGAEGQDWLERVAARLEALPGRAPKKATQDGRGLADRLREQREIYPLVHAYGAAKRARGALDFSDQMAVAARLARDVPAVREAEGQRYRAVLLDEFQDTSEAQMVLLASLFAGRELPVTAVGDPHQSIYAWRGASATTLSRFPTIFTVRGEPCPVLPLSTSWRNDAAVLDAANLVAAPLQQATEVAVATLRTRPGAGEGTIQVARLTDHLEEADHVAGWIAERRREGAQSAAVLCRTRAQFPVVVDALRVRGLPVEVVGLGGLLDAPEVLDLVALLWTAQEPTRGDQVMRLLVGPVCRLGAADVDALAEWASALAREDLGHPDRTGEVRSANLGREHAGVLAEALEQLPPPGWVGRGGQHLSPEGAVRVAALARAVRRVRSLVGLPLPDLVGEAERALGLDLEVAADPDLHPSWGRAQLDALADVAAAYAAASDRVSLGGFLAWLDAAREHERGLEAADTPGELAAVSVDRRAVQVLTVHAAKGLEWDAVAVPGLVEATFPSYRATARAADGRWVMPPARDAGWLTGLGGLPTPLRGDRHGRPDLPWFSVPDTHELKDALEEYRLAGGAYSVLEERRLAYVALTRARHDLLLTSPVWSTGKTPRVTSRFLDEICEAGDIEVTRGPWAPMPDPDDPEQNQNPRLAAEITAPWPREPDARRSAVRDVATALVTARLASPAARELAEPWAEEVLQLLAERREQQQRSGTVPLPQALSTSSVVALASDPEAFRRRLRRPLPQPPAPHARLGTAFHAWVEQHFSSPSLVDVHDLVDDDSEVEPAEDLAVLQEHFMVSEWAGRTPLSIELPVETEIGGRTVRGRIDAVFAEPDGRRTIVDWKTGAAGSPEAQRVRAVQLAVYRVAYARLAGIAVEDVDAAFFFAASGRTVRPELPGEAELEARLGELLADELPSLAAPQERGVSSSGAGMP